MGFNLLGGVGLPRLHSFLALVLPLPFVVDRVGPGMLGRWRSRKSGLVLRNGGSSLGCFLGCFSPKLGLKQLLKG